MNLSSLFRLLPMQTKKIFGSRISRVTGIDLGSQTMKVAELEYRKHGPVLTGFGVWDVTDEVSPKNSSAVVAEQLRRLTAREGIRLDCGVMAVQSEAMVLRELEFPSMPSAELFEALHWEKKSYLPKDGEEYYCDFIPISSSGHKQKIFMAAAKKSAVDYVVEIARLAGVTLHAVEIEPVAYSRVVSEENSLIIDIGKSCSRIYILHHGIPCVVRHVEQETDNNDYTGELLGSGVSGCCILSVKDLAREVDRTLEFFHMEKPGQSIKKIYLAGGGGKVADIQTDMEKLLDYVIEPLQPFQRCGVKTSFERKYIENLGPQISGAVGLAMRYFS